MGGGESDFFSLLWHIAGMNERSGPEGDAPKPRRRIGLRPSTDESLPETAPADSASFEYREYVPEELPTRNDEPFLEGLAHPGLMANWSWFK